MLSMQWIRQKLNGVCYRYGGCVLSQSISAGFKTLPASPPYYLFSLLGTILSPALTHECVTYQVEDLRTTKTFCTRKIEAWQEHQGVKRRVMVCLFDSHVREEGAVNYSAPPRGKYSSMEPENRIDTIEQISKTQPSKVLQTYKAIFPVSLRYFDYKSVPESFGDKIALGLGPNAKTLDVALHPTSKTNAAWVKSREVLQTHAEHVAALA